VAGFRCASFLCPSDTQDFAMPGEPSLTWELEGGRAIACDRPVLMAILNATPDSFSDGGRFSEPEQIADAAAEAVRAGATILDIGGESTRPGAARVDPTEQIERVVPAIRAIRTRGIGAPISVDTTRARVAAAALDAGADAVNDVSAATEDDEMLSLVAERGAGLVLMHRLAPPGEDSYSDRYDREPDYGDVVLAVRSFLAERLTAAERAGVPPRRVALDPGLGFGKSVDQNLELIRRTPEITALGRPILSGASRKSFVGRVSAPPGEEPAPPHQRDAASVAFSVAHRLAGAQIFRVHDVAAHAAALRAVEAIRAADRAPSGGFAAS